MRARLERASAAHPRRRLSRQEVADAANDILAKIYLAEPRRRGHAGLTAGYVGALERGGIRWPNDDYRRALRTLYGASDTDLGFYIDRPDGASARTALAMADLPAPAAADTTTDGWHTLVPQGDAALDRSAVPVPVHHAWLGPSAETSSFAALTQLLASQRQVIAPGALLSLVEAHRDTLSTLFRRAASDPVRTDIGALLGETSIVASRLWSAMGNRAMALAHCAFARNIADRLDNPQLAAVARIFESNLRSGAATLIDADGDVVLGLRMLEEASSLGNRLPHAARARIAAEQAQAYAALALKREAWAALDRARTAVEHVDDTDRTGLFSDWTPSRLDVYEGTCLLLLGQNDEAAQVLTAVTQELDNDPANLNVALAAKVDLAGAHAHSGELEEGCALLGSTHAELIKLGNRRGIARAARARDRLTRWQNERAVRELDSRMLDAARTATAA